MALSLTYDAATVWAPTDGSGNARGASMDEAYAWATEIQDYVDDLFNGEWGVDPRITSSGSQILNFPLSGFASSSIFIGNGGQNLLHTTGLEGYYNTGVGRRCFIDLTTGSYNTGVGFECLEDLTTGIWNTAYGEAAMIFHIAGSNHNTAIGTKAFCGLIAGTSTGDYNTFVGDSVAINAGIGNNNNVCVGALSMSSIAGAEYNVGIGFTVLSQLTSGDQNIAIGYLAGYDLTTGSGNTLIGQGLNAVGATLANTLMITSGSSLKIAADATSTRLYFGSVSNLRLSAGNQLVLGTGSALATSATSGHVCIPTMAGIPTGSLGVVGAIVLDVTNSRIYFQFSGSTWKYAALT